MKENECTLVTAYYDFPYKKSSNKNYDIWISNFLQNTNAYMVIYTDSTKTAKYLYEYRKNLMEKTKIIVEEYETLHCYQYLDYWTKDLARDHEKNYHNESLYTIWNEKTMFLYKAYVMNHFDTGFFAWVDIGMVRDDKYLTLLESFPSSNRLAKLKKDKVYLLQINPFTQDELHTMSPTETFRYKDRIGGGMILCNVDIINKWTQEYYKMMRCFMESNLFSGKDQSIMANVVIKHHTDLIELVIPKIEDFTIMDNIWFHMLYFLSDKYID